MKEGAGSFSRGPFSGGREGFGSPKPMRGYGSLHIEPTRGLWVLLSEAVWGFYVVKKGFGFKCVSQKNLTLDFSGLLWDLVNLGKNGFWVSGFRV